MFDEVLAPTPTKLPTEKSSTSALTGTMFAAVSATGVDGGGPAAPPPPPPPPPLPPHEASAATAADRTSNLAAWGTLVFILLSVGDINERRPTLPGSADGSLPLGDRSPGACKTQSP